ncbi:PREDICTED: MARCKS-related protein [Pseudopodoces humilis]|uniref:MARCKS-related protein n=1 Tax=Pseudopodoces humilis TaxID=181119 RepID=UPI000395A8FA|nr:PREDICTED: MARCKS-related protein [Pseudopodoces humilis]
MGSQGSKAAGGDPDTAKANGQENGHVIYNGDMTPKVGVEVAPQNGNGSAEPPKEESEGEAGGADTIEPAPAAADGGDPKTEGAAAPKDAPKKKKKFSFKKSFKLSGISFRKNKKEAGDSSGSSPTEEQGKSEETPPGGLQPSAPPEEEQSGPGEGGEGPEPKDGGEAAGSQEEENQQQQGGESQGDTAKPEEPSKTAGPEPTTSPAEQKEE